MSLQMSWTKSSRVPKDASDYCLFLKNLIRSRNFDKPPANGPPESPVKSFRSHGNRQLPDWLVDMLFRLEIDRHLQFGDGGIRRRRFPTLNQGINFVVDEVNRHVLLVANRCIS
mmetsp:Transcript_10880/g.23326  ORF Transcript_10880/g.23326 Transcript_10880/m.23326 type:complete len:114 (-) Transcript_10880:114-455(-)